MSPPVSVQLRPVHLDDLPTFYLQQLDVEANRVAVANPRGPESFAAHWAKVFPDPEVTVRAVVCDGVLAGQIACFVADGARSVGYWIGRDHWGKGVATQALALLLAEVAVRPIHARVATTNLGSIRVLERSGFRVVGHEMAEATERFPACEEALLVLG